MELIRKNSLWCLGMYGYSSAVLIQFLFLVFRYVLDDEVREVFVDFLEVERITGTKIGGAILQCLKKHH